MKRLLSVVVVVALALVICERSETQDERKEPTVKRNDCPRGKCCLERVGLSTKRGVMEFNLGDSYECRDHKGQSGSGFLDIRQLEFVRGCHELGDRLNVVDLKAAVHIVRRSDELASICGTFYLYAGDRMVFEGEIDLLHRVNTHVDPRCQLRCDQKNHLQGWLKGTGVDGGPLQGQLLRAMIVATTDPQDAGERIKYVLEDVQFHGVTIDCRGD